MEEASARIFRQQDQVADAETVVAGMTDELELYVWRAHLPASQLSHSAADTLPVVVQGLHPHARGAA